MIPLISKLPHVGTTIFTTMSALAAEVGAINLSQGFPDYDCPSRLVDMACKALQHGHNQYAPMAGLMELRDRIAQKTEKLYGASYHPETEITITAGATQAIYTAISAVVHANDEVIIFEPAYDAYAPAVRMMGGVVKSMPLEPPDYSINWEMVKRLISNRTKLIILNSPHNPTGTILSDDDIAILTSIIKNQDIFILSDEVYEHVIFDGAQHNSMAKYADLRDRSFIVASFGKLAHATGWKVGYCLAPEYMMKEFRKIHQFLVFAVNTPMQYALANFLAHEDSYNTLSGFFQQKRDHFRAGIEQSRFNLLPCAGSYFQTVSYRGLFDEKDTDFVLRLTRDFGVAAIPISTFYSSGTDHQVIRFCFAKKQETLDSAIERLIKI